jgi:DNA mismatch repair ATPase MutL
MPRTYKKKEWVRKYLIKRALTECRKYIKCIERELLHDERKLKRNARDAVWREKNRQKIRDRTNKWSKDNNERVTQWRRNWYAKNKEHVKQKEIERYERRKDYFKNKYATYNEFIKSKSKEYREQNREHIREYAKKKYHEIKHTEKYIAQMRANGMKRYTSKKKRCPTWLSNDDLWIIKEAYALANMRKRLTNMDWHVDHIIPLQGKTVSGLHVPNNIQVVPAKWNQYKNNRHTEKYFGGQNEKNCTE